VAAIRLLFYSHDTFGLGHFRRSLTIASHLRRHVPDTSVLIMTGLDAAYAFETPSGIDFVKLPAVKKVGPDEYRSRHLRISFNRVRRLRENLIKAVAKGFDPHMLIVDNVPRGVEGELLPTIEFLRKHRPRTRLVLTLRDVLDVPEQIVPLWQEWGVYDLLERGYDEIWVAGWRDLFDPTRLYEFPPAVVEKTKFCGYVVQHASLEAAAAIQRHGTRARCPLAVHRRVEVRILPRSRRVHDPTARPARSVARKGKITAAEVGKMCGARGRWRQLRNLPER